MLNSLLLGNSAASSGDDVYIISGTVTAAYCLLGEVAGTLSSNSVATSTGVTVDSVFANVDVNGAAAGADGLFDILPGGLADNSGVFAWHDATWDNVGYALYLTSTRQNLRGPLINLPAFFAAL